VIEGLFILFDKEIKALSLNTIKTTLMTPCLVLKFLMLLMAFITSKLFSMIDGGITT
jgi:hypothetical protein